MIPNKVFRFLSFRSRTEKEMRDYLCKHDLPEDIVFRLKELNYINDTDYIKNYIRSRTPRSKKLLEFELLKKGIKTKVDIDELAAAKNALDKKSNVKDLDHARRFLASRGFIWDVIMRVTNDKE